MGATKQLPLVWTDLPQKQLHAIRAAEGKAARSLIAQCAGSSGLSEERQAIQLDLMTHTLDQAQAWQLSDAKTSALFSIVKHVHQQAVQQRLVIDRSFTQFKDVLLRHSVQRITMNVTAYHPSDCVELPPSLPPLVEAVTDEQHTRNEQEARIQKETADLKAAEEAAAAAIEEQERLLKEAMENAMPDEIQQEVQAALQKEMERLQLIMQAQFSKQEAGLRQRIAELEGRLASTG
eukprot:jgi/Astpho2/9847/fgenesh1_pg.00149_%23_90_t